MTKKGFIVTLMTVTFALMRVSSYAEAPTIQDPGDIIIGDLEQGGANNVFVFPDAVDGDGIVSDDTTADAQIKWSYDSADDNIVINGVPRLNGADPTNPPAPNRLDQNNSDDANAGIGEDGDAFTFTFRNDNLSDETIGGGLGPYGEPGTTGVLAAETRSVTLYASDCSTYSSVSIVVYTSNETSDSISGGGAGLTPVLDHDFDNDPSLINGWFGGITGGSCTTGTATGLCMWVAANNPASAGAGWISPPNFVPGPAYIDLTAYNVYRIRLYMTTDQTATGAIPFWTFGYNNANFTGVGGPGNSYGGDKWILDVAGGSNGINGPANGRPNGRTTYDFWFCPNAVLTQQWNGVIDAADSAFAPSVDGINDMNLIVRILDGAQGTGSIRNEVDTGTVCVTRLTVDRTDVRDLASRTTLAYGSPITNTLYAVNPDSFASGGNGTGTIDNGTNTATFNMGPWYDGGTAARVAGGRKSLIFFDPTAVVGSDFNAALYPILWQDDQLLQIAAGIRSGVGGGTGTVEGTNPVDVIFINFDSPTSEIGGFNFTQRSVPTNMHRAGSPRLMANTGGSSQIYTSFMSSQNATDIDLTIPGFENANRIRGYVDFINNSTLGSNSDGLDAVTIDSMVLNTIDTTGFN
jgi:hypothetical protein